MKDNVENRAISMQPGLLSKNNIAAAVLTIVALFLAGAFIYNASLQDKPEAGIISFYGFQLNQHHVTRGDILDSFFGLAIITTLLIVPVLGAVPKDNKETLYDHLVFAVLLVTAVLTCFVTFIQYEIIRDDYFTSSWPLYQQQLPGFPS